MKTMFIRGCTALFFLSIPLIFSIFIAHPQQSTYTASTLESPGFESVQSVAELIADTTTPDASDSLPVAVLIAAPDYAYDPGTLAVVNFQATWGNKSANIAAMTDYIYQAYDQGVKLIVFPELAVTGYSANSDSETWDYQMPVAYAETTSGTTATTFSALAQELDMWIIYGATESYSATQAYNAAFICSPDGSVETYRKIAPVEGNWCRAGSEPLVIDAGDLGLLGFGICYDTYAHPELGQYYANAGCDLYINLTASSVYYSQSNDDAWLYYYTSRLESLAYQSGLHIASANLVNSCGGYFFPGGSVFVSPNQSLDVTVGEEGLVLNQAMDTAAPVSVDAQAASQWYSQIASISVNPKYDYTATVAPVVSMATLEQATLWDVIGAMQQANSQGVDLLLLPSSAMTASSSSAYDTITQTLAYYAQLYDMYLCFGIDSPQTDTTMVITCPDGTIQTHQTGVPLILETPWGDLGMALGDELYENPLLCRYYGAMGCKGVVHIGDTLPDAWQAESLLSVYGARDSLAIATCSPSVTGLVTVFHNQAGDQAIDWSTGSAVDWAEITSPTPWSLEDTGFAVTYFNAGHYAQWFDTAS